MRDVERDQGQSVAAVLYEPVMAAGGVLVPPSGYGERLRELANRCGALLIAEEVTTGVGRTGRWFGFEHDAIVPDILVIGKAIGAGLPVAVVVTTAEVEDRCQGILRHVQSHQNDPLSGQVATTVISVLQDERLVDQVTERGAYLLEGLKELQARSSQIYDVRGKGLMVGVELGAEWTGIGAQVQHSLLEDEIIVDYQPHTATFRLFPPYIISEQEIERFLVALGAALQICVQKTKRQRRHLH
jgi:4-aminobutyrate aminotransferase-like enzyme